MYFKDHDAFVRCTRYCYRNSGQISIKTALSTRAEKEMEEGGWKNESQWSRFSGFKGEGGFSRRARFHPSDASLVRRWQKRRALFLRKNSLSRASF